MNKKIHSLAILTGLTLLGTNTAVLAAPVGNLDTNVTASFTEDKTPAVPLDPTDPTKPVKPERPGTTGPLSLDAVPTGIDFGTNELKAGQNLTLLAKPMKVTHQDDTQKEVPHYVQVTDKRGGRLGWKLTVRQTAQLKSTGGVDLTGAVMSLNKQTISSPSTEVAPTGFTGKLDLTPGSDVTVMTAAAGQGYLTWIQKYGSLIDDGSGKANVNDGVQLMVPSGAAQATKYTGSLVWTLNDTPA
ncbi:WxL domain-containing protein [Companilactobacillus sp. DQM5]|uniref:WxL domain-containing protein n=1 Tax=Companilactobacillus sp. DQM5 TaxID=3463359 RepID=UPI0040584DF1